MSAVGGIVGGTGTAADVSVYGRLRPTSGMWSGATKLLMLSDGASSSLSLVGGMTDVWQIDQFSGTKTTMFATSGCPHVGGALPSSLPPYLVYIYDGLTLSFYAKWDDARLCWVSFDAPYTMLSLSFSRVEAPAAVVPSALAPSDWASAPAHRKCFFVTVKTASSMLGGWYSYRKLPSEQEGHWYKAAYASFPEARLVVTNSNGTETVKAASNAATVTCQLAGVNCDTAQVAVGCFLRPVSGVWSGATTLTYAMSGVGTDTCSRVVIQGGYYMDDVWQLATYKTLFLTESGCPHVGGPLAPAPNLVYSYDGTNVNYLTYSHDKTSWRRYSDNALVALKVSTA
jgi:hypothetical protein